MKTKTLGVILATIALCAVPASAATVLSLSGPLSPVGVGTQFEVSVHVTGAVDLASYQFDIGYNPALVHGISVQEGPFLPSAGATLFVPGAIDDLSGSVSFTAGALVGLGPGASGDGILATFRFQGVSEGTANFSLLSPLLYDSIPTSIEVSANGTSTTIEGATVPEPTSMLLAASGLGLLFLVRRKR